MPAAQGWTIADSREVKIPLKDGSLQVTRLHNVRQLTTPKGKLVPIYSLNYYWFVGFHHLTASHLERTFIDIRDPILNGYNQRWAYVTVTATITEGLVPFGRSEAQTDMMIQGFIGQLSSQINRPPDEQVSRQRRETLAGPSSTLKDFGSDRR